MTAGLARPAEAVPETAGTASARANLYGFLSSAFRLEPDAALLRRLREPGLAAALAAAGAALDDAFMERPEADLVEELALEFTRLFIGPGNHTAPYGAIYLDGEGASLWGPTTVWVKAFIEAAGFDFRAEYHGFPDHFSVELEFMGDLCAREAQALDDGDADQAAAWRAIEQQFVADHMAAWIPRFCAEMVERAEAPFYRGLAGLTADFVGSEAEALIAS